MEKARGIFRRPVVLLLLITLLGTFARARFIHRGLHDYHTWRQVDTAVIAKNFYRHGMNIFYPETMWNGDEPSYVASEFQLYPWLVAVLYHLFGPNDVLGRALSVAAYAASSFVLYRLCSLLWSPVAALWAAYAFAIHPLAIGYMRTFQPESFMILFSLSALLCWWHWSEGRPNKWALWGSVFVALAVLLKLPNLYLGLPMAFLVFKRLRWRFWRHPIIYASILISLAPAAAWWWHCHDFPVAFIRFWEPGSQKWGNAKLWLSNDFYLFWANHIPLHVIFTCSLTFFLLGWTTLSKAAAPMMLGWTIGIAIFIFALAEALQGPEEYYGLPLIPLISAWIGGGAGWLWSSSAAGSPGRKPLCILFGIWMFWESWTRVRGYYHEQIDQPLLRDAVEITRRHVGPQDLVVWVTTYGFPELFYHADRRGWKLTPGLNSEIPSDFLKRTERNLYATFSAGNPEELAHLLGDSSQGRDLAQYTLVEKSGNNAVFALRSNVPPPPAND